MSAPRTARDRVRDEVTAEILAVAAVHLAREGAAALSLRSIARDLEMAPSALYRYFSSRDALLSALILGAYESLAAAAQAAASAVDAADADALARWSAVPNAMRAWALEHPHEWGLIFGSPVPGYEAPQATVAPYVALAEALVRPLKSAPDRAKRSPAARATSRQDRALADALEPVTDGLLPGFAPSDVAASLSAFAGLIGIISLEVFGHWRRTVLAPALLFDETVASMARTLGVCP